MKKIRQTLIATTLILISQNLLGQNHRVLTFHSYCYQIVYYTDPTYTLWDYKSNDSTLIIEGRLGYWNCGDDHVFTATIDSNSIVLTRQIIDTMPMTCNCDIRIKMTIDSFNYNTYHVEFEGNLITSTPDIITNKLYYNIAPNPSTDFISINSLLINETTPIKIYDILGNLQLMYFIKNTHEKINISQLRRGVYIIMIGNKTMKLIKE